MNTCLFFYRISIIAISIKKNLCTGNPRTIKFNRNNNSYVPRYVPLTVESINALHPIVQSELPYRAHHPVYQLQPTCFGYPSNWQHQEISSNQLLELNPSYYVRNKIPALNQSANSFRNLAYYSYIPGCSICFLVECNYLGRSLQNQNGNRNPQTYYSTQIPTGGPYYTHETLASGFYYAHSNPLGLLTPELSNSERNHNQTHDASTNIEGQFVESLGSRKNMERQCFHCKAETQQHAQALDSHGIRVLNRDSSRTYIEHMHSNQEIYNLIGCDVEPNLISRPRRHSLNDSNSPALLESSQDELEPRACLGDETDYAEEPTQSINPESNKSLYEYNSKPFILIRDLSETKLKVDKYTQTEKNPADNPSIKSCSIKREVNKTCDQEGLKLVYGIKGSSKEVVPEVKEIEAEKIIKSRLFRSPAFIPKKSRRFIRKLGNLIKCQRRNLSLPYEPVFMKQVLEFILNKLDYDLKNASLLIIYLIFVHDGFKNLLKDGDTETSHGLLSLDSHKICYTFKALGEAAIQWKNQNFQYVTVLDGYNILTRFFEQACAGTLHTISENYQYSYRKFVANNLQYLFLMRFTSPK